MIKLVNRGFSVLAVGAILVAIGMGLVFFTHVPATGAVEWGLRQTVLFLLLFSGSVITLLGSIASAWRIERWVRGWAERREERKFEKTFGVRPSVSSRIKEVAVLEVVEGMLGKLATQWDSKEKSRRQFATAGQRMGSDSEVDIDSAMQTGLNAVMDWREARSQFLELEEELHKIIMLARRQKVFLEAPEAARRLGLEYRLVWKRTA